MSIEYDKCLKRGKIKPFSRGKGLVSKEIEAAWGDYQRAEKTFHDQDYKWATIQLYYSMFHSARALLYYKNLNEKSHFCLIEAIRALYVEKKLVPSSLLGALQQAKALREDADYYNRWSEAGCKKMLNSAKNFLSKAEQITQKTGRIK